MGDTWITDLSHFLDETGDLVQFAGRPLAMHLCRIVEAVTTGADEHVHHTSVRCRRRPGRVPCIGTITASLDQYSETIRWMCPECGDNGLISGWAGTKWDHRDPDAPTAVSPPELRVIGGRDVREEEPIDLFEPDTLRMVNRSAAVVTPREPFVHWATHVDDDAARIETAVRANVSVYLVPPDPREERESAPLKQWYATVFERELEGWCRDVTTWPQNRDVSLFLKWFNVTTQSLVEDLGIGMLEVEDW